MLKSIWGKFFLALFIVLLFGLSSTLLLRYLVLKDFRDFVEGQTEDKIYLLIANLEDSYKRYNSWNSNAMVNDIVFALMEGIEVKVFDNNGNLVTDTEKAIAMLNPAYREKVISLSNFSPSRDLKDFTTYPLFSAKKEIGSLEVHVIYPERELIFISRSNKFLLLSVLITGCLAIILSIAFSRELTKNIKTLEKTVANVSKGKLKEAPVLSEDEIGKLAMSFNEMIKTLKNQEVVRKKIVTNVAHEIRTPIAAIKGELSAIIDGLLPNNKEQIMSVYEEVQRLENIVEGLEAYARIQSNALFLNKQKIMLKMILEKIVNTYEAMFMDKGVKLTLLCPEDINIYADPEKIKQIIVNLLTNALKATGQDGEVIITAFSTSNNVCISISDTGCGIEPHSIPFIFERFYRKDKGGLGLGLAIVKELVDAHEGSIDVKTEQHKGTTFTVCFPVKQSS